MYLTDNGLFGTIKTDLDNKMTCGLYSYPKTKYKTVGILNNYHVGKQLTRATIMKEEVVFAQTRRDTNTSKTRKKGESKCFHCDDPNNWAYECPQLSEKKRFKLSATKERGGHVHTQVSEVVEDEK